MRHAGLTLICLLTGGTGTAAAAAGAPAAYRSALAGVGALEKPVSYTDTNIPLGELVRKIAADIGVKLQIRTWPGRADLHRVQAL